MKTRSLLLIITVLALFSSCEKDKNELISSYTPPAPAVVYPNYSKLAIGNYWVYQRSTLTPAGVYIPTAIDSCYINRDTMIGGLTYFVYTEPSVSGSPTMRLYRDSLHYILDLHKIVFSSQDNSTIFDSGYKLQGPGDTLAYYESKMTDIDTTITNGPGGSFKSSAFITNYYMYPSYSGGGSVRYIYARHAKNIGIVEESLPFNSSSPNYEIRQILRYHVN